MLNLRTTKVLRDLNRSKTRTALVVLTIAIGVFAVSSISRAWVILSQNLSENFLAANPTSATIFTTQPFDQTVVDKVAALQPVRAAEGRNGILIRVKTGTDDWRLLRLIVRSDFENQQINLVRTQSGEWPPAQGSILLERSSLAMTGLALGDDLVIQLPTGQERSLTLSGTVYDINQVSTIFSNIAYGYITPETYRALTTLSGFNALDIVVRDPEDPELPSSDKAYIKDVVEEVSALLKAENLIISEKRIPVPLRHPLDNIIQSVLLLMGALAFLAIFLSAFLVINAISALIAQQIRQIGTIKAIGGRSGTIGWLYINTILIMGVLAGLLAIPLGALTAYFAAVIIAGLINFEITSYTTPGYIFALEFFASLFVPVFAALVPVWGATRITVREAISTGGSEGSAFGGGLIDRLLNALRGLPSAWLYAFRNIFRKKMRLLLALITLTAAGAIFIAVLSVRSSLEQTINEIASYWQEDISLRFYTNIPADQAEEIASGFTKITRTEGRLQINAFRLREDGSESANLLTVLGLPVDTPLLQPKLLAGRWLDGQSADEIVINVDLLAIEPGIQPGDTLKLRLGRFETEWKVVGIVTSQLVGVGELLQAPLAYARYEVLAAAVEQEGKINKVLLSVDPAEVDKADIRPLSIEIEKAFAGKNLRVVSRLLNSDMRLSLENAFSIILILIQLMSILFALVGALGLAGMMSLSVLERTREIGVIRVVGAVQSVVAQVTIIEGVFIGVLSWLGGSIAAYPLSLLLDRSLGLTLLRVALSHVFPLQGILLWLALVIVLSVLASLLPAISASRLSVRETMAFE